MSSNNIFPSMSAEITSEQLCGDVDGNVIVSTDWYTPVSVSLYGLHLVISFILTITNQYTYEQPYLTPFPSSTVEPQQWNQYARASIPDINMTTYPMGQQANFSHTAFQAAPGRPRSSPSTFGPSPESISWAPSAGLGIQYTTGAPQPTPMTSTFQPTAFPTYAAEDLFETPSPPQLQQPQPRRPYQPIAPNPAGIPTPKRGREEDDASDTPSSNKRRRGTSTSTMQNLSEDEAYLVHLKETEGLPWKDIVARFKDDKGKVFSEPALQMKHTRLRQRSRAWEENDVHALEQAHKYWERCKWTIISEKVSEKNPLLPSQPVTVMLTKSFPQMLEYGISEKWHKGACERKWREMTFPTTTAPVTAPAAQFSSPGTSMAYSWVPFH